MRTRKRIPKSLVIGGVLFATGAALAAFLRTGSPDSEAAAPPPAPAAKEVREEREPSPPPEVEAPAERAELAAGPVDIDRVRLMLDPGQAVVVGDQMVQQLPDGTSAVLSLRPDVQQAILDLFEKYDVPLAAAVAIEVATGRVVVFASRSRAPTERPPMLDARSRRPRCSSS